MGGGGEGAAWVEGRVVTVRRCRELVGDEAQEREAGLLRLNSEGREAAAMVERVRGEVEAWRVQLEEAARCLAVVQAWTARHSQQAEVPHQALRRQVLQEVRQEVQVEQGVKTKKPPLPSKPPKPAPSVGQVAYLTLAQFEAVPKYMKGRTTYEVLNQAVDELNTALQEKYTFLANRMADLPNRTAKKRHQALRAQESKDTKGAHFVTAEELRHSAHLKSETGRRSLLTILRHFGLTREIRGPGSIVRFAVARPGRWE